MPRRRRRRLVYAVILVALAILPHIIHVYGGARYTTLGQDDAPTINVFIFDRLWFHTEARITVPRWSPPADADCRRGWGVWRKQTETSGSKRKNQLNPSAAAEIRPDGGA